MSLQRYGFGGAVFGFALLALLVLFFGHLASALELTRQEPKGPYPGTVAANDLDVTFTAAVVGDATFACTGKELVLFHNSGVSAVTFTIDAQVDIYNRDADITSYSIGADEYAAFWFGNTVGWRDSNGVVTMDASSTDLKYAVIGPIE